MYYTPKCPSCGGKIKILDVFNVTHEKEECILSCVGECLKCGHEIEWNCCYPFGYINNICDTMQA